MTERKGFEGWAILELMGHRRLTGHVSEVEIAGSSFIQLDVPAGEGDVDAVTQFYSPAAVYCITPTTEELVRAMRTIPRPVHEYELRRALPAGDERERFLHEVEPDDGELADRVQ